MNHELLKSVIFDQHAAIQAARITPRGYTFEENANYVLVGLRRAGKSALLFDIARKLMTQGLNGTRSSTSILRMSAWPNLRQQISTTLFRCKVS